MVKLTYNDIRYHKFNEATREKHCQNQKRWRIENPEKVAKQNEQKKLSRDFHRIFKTENYHREMLTRRMYIKAKTSYKWNVYYAKDLNIPWNLSLKDFRFFVKFPCAFCGCDKELIRLLERIDYSKGFQFNNVLPSCVKCANCILYYKK